MRVATILHRSMLGVAIGIGGFGFFTEAGRAEILSASPTEVEHDPAGGQWSPEVSLIPGGRFLMGSPETEAGHGPDRATQVEIAMPDFYLARFPVTRAEFAHFVEATGYVTDAERAAGDETQCHGKGPDANSQEYRARDWRAPGFRQGDRHPVVCVSWNDARVYTSWLSAQTGHSYRLPTEAEWEYAARAGTAGARYWGESADAACAFANVADEAMVRAFTDWDRQPMVVPHGCDDGRIFTAPVGSYAPNPWGLYDMLGNVWEWTCSASDATGAPGRITCDVESPERSVRGGSWGDGAGHVGAASRRGALSGSVRGNDLGFRVLRESLDASTESDVADAFRLNPEVESCTTMDRGRLQLAGLDLDPEPETPQFDLISTLPARVALDIGSCLNTTSQRDEALIDLILRSWVEVARFDHSLRLAEAVFPLLSEHEDLIHAHLWKFRVSGAVSPRLAERVRGQWGLAREQSLSGERWSLWDLSWKLQDMESRLPR